MPFDSGFKKVIVREGGYTWDPNDKGLETKYGISKRFYPHINIKSLTLEQARGIYYTDYWIKGKCDKLPINLDEDFFDACVNMGIRTATTLLQKAINNLAISQILVDGVMGPKTLREVSKIPVHILRTYLKVERLWVYMEIADNNISQRGFLRGWLHRLLD